MPEQDPGPIRVRDLSVEAHGSTVLILHGDGDEPERRVFQGIPVAPGDGLVLASSIAARTSSFRSALRHACRMALTAAAKQRLDDSAEPRLWLAVSGLGRGDGRGKAAAQKIAREFSAEVFAPDGPLTFVAGGSIFAGADHHRWMRFVEGAPGEFHSARYPQPDWESQLPRGEVADGGLQTRPVPAGLAVSADDVLSHSVAVSAWHPRLVLGSPGGDLIAPHQVAALLRRFPKPLLDRIQLVPADPRTASSQWLFKLAELVEHDVVSATGLVRHDTRAEFVYIADEAGNPLWQPFPAMLRYSPTGTATPVGAGPPPRGWTPGPLVYRWSGAPSPRPVPQEIVAKVVPSGLALLPAAELGQRGAADRLTFESGRFTVALGWPCAPVPEGTQVALYRLLAGLAPEQLARLRVLVLGVADERMRSEILSAAGEWAPRVSFPSVLTAPLVSPQHARARGYGSEAEAEAAAEAAGANSGGAVRVAGASNAGAGSSGSGVSGGVNGVPGASGSAGTAAGGGAAPASAVEAAETGSGSADESRTSSRAVDRDGTLGSTGGSGAEPTASRSADASAEAERTANGSTPAVPPAPSTVSASDPVSAATVRLSRSLIQTAAESSGAATETAAPAQVPAMSSAARFTKVQRTATSSATGSNGTAVNGTAAGGAGNPRGSAGDAAPGAATASRGSGATVNGAAVEAKVNGTAANGATTNGAAASATAGASAPAQAAPASQAARPREALPKREPGASPLSRESAKRRAAAAARLAAAQEKAQRNASAASTGTAPKSAEERDTASPVAGSSAEQQESVGAERKSAAAEPTASAAATVAADSPAPTSAPATGGGPAPADTASVVREQGEAEDGTAAGSAEAVATAEPAAVPSEKAGESTPRSAEQDTSTPGQSTSDSIDPGTIRIPHIGATGAAAEAAPQDRTPATEMTTRIPVVPAEPPTPPTAPPVPPVVPVTSSTMPVTSSGPVGKSQATAPGPTAPPTPAAPPAPAEEPAAPAPEAPSGQSAPTSAATPDARPDEEAPNPADTEPPAEQGPADPAEPAPALIPAEARPEFGPDHQSTDAQRTAFARLVGDAYEAALPSVNTALATFPALREEQIQEAKSDFVAVHVYLGDGDFGATTVNAVLRRGITTELGDYLACLLSGLRRLPVHRGPVFRLLDAEALDAYEPGMLLTEPAFLSASSAPEITAPRGSEQNTDVIIWSQSSRRTSAFHRLGLIDEVVFPAGSRFRVLAVDRPDSAEPAALLLRELRVDEEPAHGELTDTDQALLPRLRRALDRRRRSEPQELGGDALSRVATPIGLVPND